MDAAPTQQQQAGGTCAEVFTSTGSMSAERSSEPTFMPEWYHSSGRIAPVRWRITVRPFEPAPCRTSARGQAPAWTRKTTPAMTGSGEHPLNGVNRDNAFVPPDGPIRFRNLGRMIGNAVPVALARAVARAIGNHLNRGGP